MFASATLSPRGSASAARRRVWPSLAILVLAAGLLSGCGINNIPTYEESAKANWSQVLNQYKRRADLVPNLVKVVREFAEHERQVLTEVVEARSKATQINLPADVLTNPEAFKKFQELQSQLSGALAKLLAVVERYPDIKSSQNYLTLQSQLEGTENRIAVARRDYIEAVRRYNTELKTFPGRWWRSLLYPEAKPMETFTINEDDSKPPQV